MSEKTKLLSAEMEDDQELNSRYSEEQMAEIVSAIDAGDVVPYRADLTIGKITEKFITLKAQNGAGVAAIAPSEADLVRHTNYGVDLWLRREISSKLRDASRPAHEILDQLTERMYKNADGGATMEEAREFAAKHPKYKAAVERESLEDS